MHNAQIVYRIRNKSETTVLIKGMTCPDICQETNSKYKWIKQVIEEDEDSKYFLSPLFKHGQFRVIEWIYKNIEKLLGKAATAGAIFGDEPTVTHIWAFWFFGSGNDYDDLVHGALETESKHLWQTMIDNHIWAKLREYTSIEDGPLLPELEPKNSKKDTLYAKFSLSLE